MAARDPGPRLRADVVYLSPSGRRCRWLPPTDGGRQIRTYAVFEYVDIERKPRHVEAAQWCEGFHLAPANYRLLREDHSAAMRGPRGHA